MLGNQRRLTDADDFAFSGFILWWNGAVLFAGNLVVIWALTSTCAAEQSRNPCTRARGHYDDREIAEREHLQGALLDFTERGNAASAWTWVTASVRISPTRHWRRRF